MDRLINDPIRHGTLLLLLICSSIVSIGAKLVRGYTLEVVCVPNGGDFLATFLGEEEEEVPLN